MLQLILVLGSIWLLGFGLPVTLNDWLAAVGFVVLGGIGALIGAWLFARNVKEYGEARFDTRNKEHRDE